MSVEGGRKGGAHKEKGGPQKSKGGAAPRYDALAKALKTLVPMHVMAACVTVF